jgi:type IV pilus assembly protein PilO
MAAISALEGKPWYVGLIGGVVLGGLVVLGLHELKLKPMKQQIAGQRAELAQLEQQIQEGRAAKQRLPQFREEVRRLELELEKLLRILPTRRNTEDLLRRIRSLVEQGDHRLDTFVPGTLREGEFYSEWPIAIGLKGTYHNLAMFFDRVSRFPRIINIDNLKVTAITEGRFTISSTFTASTFVYRETEEEKAGGDQ